VSLNCRRSSDSLFGRWQTGSIPQHWINWSPTTSRPHQRLGSLETLKHGIGSYHDALDKQDKRIVQRLFESESGGHSGISCFQGMIQFILLESNSFMVFAGCCMESTCVQSHGYHNGCSILWRERTSIHRLPSHGCASDDGVCLPTTGKRKQPMCTYVPTDANKKFLSEGRQIESHCQLTYYMIISLLKSRYKRLRTNRMLW
jgi:pre-mRNA-splicing helicase BRR2